MSTNHFDQIKTYLPWIRPPLIVNGPMAGFAGPALATAVALSGGHGQIGSINDQATLEKQLREARQNFASSDNAATAAGDYYKRTRMLPIGVGFLLFRRELDAMAALVQEYQPAVVWLFAAPSWDDYTEWATTLRKASPKSKVWIQAGSVAAALHLAEHAKPDVLVIQGADAGGHGYERGAGIVSLLPEAVDALAAGGFGQLPVLAAGGIVDGRGVASALILGATGVVMGTRFLSATETMVHPQLREKILSTTDGGQTTIRAKVFDELRGPNVWPVEYDGRGLITASYRDHAGGLDIEEIRKLHSEAVKKPHSGFGDGDEGRAVIWMGTGVGLVKKQQPTSEVVEDARDEVRKALSSATAKI